MFIQSVANQGRLDIAREDTHTKEYELGLARYAIFKLSASKVMIQTWGEQLELVMIHCRDLNDMESFKKR